MIKQILFDCGGVLVELNFRCLMEKITGDSNLAELFINRLWCNGSPWLRYDSGELNTQQVVPALKDFMPPELRGYIDAFVSLWLEALPPIREMDEIVDEIKAAGLGCYILSNFSEEFQKMPDHAPVLRKMDGLVISYKTHLLKPDPAAFFNALKTLGLKAEETLFIDDNVTNVQASIACGMEGYHFTNPDAFRTYLHNSGILPPGGE